VGWNPLEYESLGQKFHVRGSRQAEQVDLLRKLWTQRLVDYDGDFHRVPDGGLNPLPVQQPIPIWFGGGADAVLRRMAKLGDGWMPNTASPDDLAPMLKRLHTYLRDAGRDPETYGLDVRIDMKRIDPSAWAERVRRLEAMGVTHICINTMGMGFDLDEHLSAVARFRESV
jgi:alkanesulfonate monooxygenase SsuD/methylene tetrahydromethanopterin reductase-like flavin-dependent oxidoreductase (luciferase family)